MKAAGRRACLHQAAAPDPGHRSRRRMDALRHGVATGLWNPLTGRSGRSRVMAPGRQSRRKPSRAKPRARPPIPFDQFLAEAERLKARALQMLRADGAHSPVLILFTDTGPEVAGLQLQGGRPLHEVVKAVVRTRRARAFVCIAEAWMVTGPAAASLLPPSQSPERQQVLAISAVHPEGTRGWFIPFANEGGRVVLGAPVDSTGMTVRGGIPEALAGEEDRP